MTKPLHVCTFSGIGGFSLAAHWAGFHTALFCEIEPYPRAVLAKHWPDVPCHDDIKTLTADVIQRYGINPGAIDLITGGFPCQDVSAAGRGDGIHGAKSSLWFELLRVIGECLPRWVVIENSPVLRVRGADIVLEGLEGLGYTCWPLVVGADDAGAPHKRKRAFIVAHSNRNWQSQPCGGIADERGRTLDRRQELADAGGAVCERRREGAGWRIRGTECLKKDVADACRAGCIQRRFPVTDAAERDTAECCRQDVADADDGAIPNAEWRPERGNGAGLHGETELAESDRAIESGLGGNVDELPGRMDCTQWAARPGEAQNEGEPPRTGFKIPNRAARLKCLGNAVVPSTVYPILQWIADQIRQEP